jgi:hypothetical protein
MKRVVNIFLIFQILFLLVYVFLATENIVYQDQLDPTVINTIQKFYNGNLKMSDMWGIYNGGINMFGGQLLMLLNIILFRLNTRMDMILGLVCVLLSSYFLIRYINKIFNKTNEKLVMIICMAIIFIETSLVQWENIVFSGGSIQLIGVCFFLELMYVFERILFNTLCWKNLFEYFVMVLLCLLFGGQYTLGLFITLFIVFFINFLLSKDKRKRLIKISPILLILMFGFYFFYSSIFTHDNIFIRDIGKTISFLEQIIVWFKFILLNYCGSVLGVDVFRNLEINLEFGYFIGFIVLCIYIYTIYLFFKKEIYRRTLIPFLLIIYANVTIAIITLERSIFGDSYALTSRYTTSTVLGLIGSVIVLSFVFFEKGHKNIKKLNLLIIIFFIFCLGFTNVIEWKNVPFRKKYYKKLEIMALNPKLYNENELSMFQAKSMDCIYNGFSILKEYKLNIFK